ncbi:MAG: diguanylate cyclase [Pigmentiphaga sp.]|nr:diguanylate cyclase [Pigmentiphaga sp.]
MIPDATPVPPPAGRQTTLKFRLILPFVAILAAFTVIVAILSYSVGAALVRNLMDELLTEKVERIGQMVDRHILGSGAVLETAFPRGKLASPDIRDNLRELQERFWAATTLHPEPNDYVYYGNEAGQGFGIKRLAPDEVEVRLRLRDGTARDILRLDSLVGQPRFVRKEEQVFDPRTRPWYRAGRSATGHTWTSVYVDFSSQDLVVTRARHVLAEAGGVGGVVATDVSLSQLNLFMSQLPLTPNALAMIVEPDGDLIAASFTDNLQRDTDGNLERVNIHDDPSPLIQTALRALLPRARAATPDTVGIRMLEGLDGEGVYVAYERLTDEAGLDWLTLIVVPIQDIEGDVALASLGATLLGALAMAVALVLGLRSFGRVADDIGDLCAAVDALSRGRPSKLPQVARNDEIGRLARSFEAMQQALFTDRVTDLANRNALQPFLELQIEAASRGTADRGFAVLFADLNRFKPINDRYGHENGDRALREVAQRLREQAGPGDFLARLGGDEFVMVLAAPTTLAEAEHKAEALKAALQRPLETLADIPAGVIVTVGTSVGIAMYPEDGEDSFSLLKAADLAMYRDKEAADGSR